MSIVYGRVKNLPCTGVLRKREGRHAKAPSQGLYRVYGSCRHILRAIVRLFIEYAGALSTLYWRLFLCFFGSSPGFFALAPRLAFGAAFGGIGAHFGFVQIAIFIGVGFIKVA